MSAVKQESVSDLAARCGEVRKFLASLIVPSDLAPRVAVPAATVGFTAVVLRWEFVVNDAPVSIGMSYDGDEPHTEGALREYVLEVLSMYMAAQCGAAWVSRDRTGKFRTAAAVPVSVAPPEFLSFTEAGRLMGVGVKTVQSLVDQGRLTFVTIGDKKRVARSVVEAYIQAATRYASAPPVPLPAASQASTSGAVSVNQAREEAGLPAVLGGPAAPPLVGQLDEE